MTTPTPQKYVGVLKFAFNEGWHCCDDGYPATENPFDRRQYVAAWEAWRAGWKEANDLMPVSDEAQCTETE